MERILGNKALSAKSRSKTEERETPPSPSSAGPGLALHSGDFRLYLQSVLAERCRSNPRYSLRAFARLFGVEPSFLSKLLSGKRAITRRTLAVFSAKLGLGPAEVARFGGVPDAAAVAEEEFRSLTLDHFQIISDWYHFAILELVGVNGARGDASWISRALGISVNEARIAVERMLRLGMLERDRRGMLRNIGGNHTSIADPFTAVAFRKMQKQVLEKAIQALEEVPIEERNQTSMTLAIDSRDLPAAKEHLKRFRREFTARLQPEGKPRDRVYHLSLSFYPVSRNIDPKGRN